MYATREGQTEMIAGALMYSKYSLPLKWIMKRIARIAGEDTDTSKDYEYTDWKRVKRYAEQLYETSDVCRSKRVT